MAVDRDRVPATALDIASALVGSEENLPGLLRTARNWAVHGQLQLAQELYAELVKRVPQMRGADLTQLGQTASLLSRYEDAAHYFEAAASDAGPEERAAILYALARMYRDIGSVRVALGLFREVMEIGRGDLRAAATYEGARILQDLQLYSDAELLFRELSDADHDLALSATFDLAELMAETGRPVEALHLFERVHAGGNSRLGPHALLWIAQLLERLAEPLQAVEAYRELAQSSNPTLAQLAREQIRADDGSIDSPTVEPSDESSRRNLDRDPNRLGNTVPETGALATDGTEAFDLGRSLLVFYVRLPFPLPLTPQLWHHFDWGADYRDSAAMERMGQPPFVALQLIHLREDVAPSPVRAGYMEGIKLILDQYEVSDGPRHQPEPEPEPAVWSEDSVFIQTWVELVTPSELFVGEDDEDPVTACFERCLAQLNRLIRAYSFVVEDTRVHAVNKEALDPVIFVERIDVPTGQRWGRGLFTLHWNYNTPIEEVAPEKEELVYTVIHLQGTGHPFTRYREWLERAKHSRYRRGDYEEAILQLQTSVECLLSGLIRSIAVDEGRSESEIDDVIQDSTSFATIVTSLVPAKIGGTWDISNSHAPAGRYWRDLYLLRNRLVHAGDPVTYYEVEAAFSAYKGLMDYVESRLLSRPRRFPRTILALLGQPGLEKRGHWSRFLREFAERASEEPSPFYWPADKAGRTADGT